MKWMSFDRKRRILEFKLEEHEMVDDMNHYAMFTGPKTNEKDAEKVIINSPSAKIGPQWNLKIQVPESVQPHLGRWEFVVIGEPIQTHGQRIIASGFSFGTDFVCHQAISKRV